MQSAKDLIIKVPRGTVIKEAKTGRIMADLSGNEPVVLARGGNVARVMQLATATRQQPRFAKPGLPEKNLRLY